MVLFNPSVSSWIPFSKSLCPDSIVSFNRTSSSCLLAWIVIISNSAECRNEITVGTLAQEGKDSKAVLERAGEAYETLMTSPRSDLGDSIQKAFQNVDDVTESDFFRNSKFFLNFGCDLIYLIHC